LDSSVVLSQILLKVGGSRIDDEAGWANFTDSRVVDFLLKYGREFPAVGLECLRETPFPGYQKPLDPVHCHRNCATCVVTWGMGRASTNSSRVGAEQQWHLYCHSWCIKRTGPENVIETTTPRIAYFDLSCQMASIRLLIICPQQFGRPTRELET